MLSPEMAEKIRAISNVDRLRMTLRMIDESLPLVTRGSPEVVRRRFERIHQENDERNALLLAAFARTVPAK